jgi:hypothetical protein
MPKMKKTQFFAVVVAILVAATYYFEFYKSTRDEQKNAEESKVVSFPADQIHGLEVENSHGKVVLVRDTDGWTVVEPLKDWADNQFVEDVINGLTTEVSKETAAEGNVVQWTNFGLDKDFGKITFTNQQNRSMVIEVSQKKNFEGNSFLRRDGENRVLVSSSQWMMRAQATVMDFRDKRLFRGKIGSVEEISLKNIKDDFKVQLKEGHWQNPRDPAVKLDQNKIREILTSLNEIQAVDFLTSLPPAEQKANLTLKLKDKTWSGNLKQAADKMIYAQVTDPKFFLKMKPGQAEKFFDMTLASLRDRKEAFDFENLLVQKIEIETPVKKWALQKHQETWNLVGDDKAVIEEKSVRSFITRLSDSSVTEYLDKSDQAHFKGPFQKMILKGENDKILFTLTWGPSIKKKLLVGDNTLILAQSSLYKDVFGLDPSVVESWGLTRLLPKGTL